MIVADARDSEASLKDLSPLQYSRVLQLLDESIGMAPAERDVWLGEIGRSDPTTAALLRNLYDCMRRDFWKREISCHRTWPRALMRIQD
jgi:hypothetical protein